MKPILFNTEMVKAILEGRKTVTRRVIKNVDSEWNFEDLQINPSKSVTDKWGELYPKEVKGLYATFFSDDAPIEYPMYKSPYQVGDVLYVRETWNFGFFDSSDDPYNPGSWFEECSKAEKKYISCHYIYRADYTPKEEVEYGVEIKPGIYRMPWRPSLHMPKEAARIFLRVTDIKVERLQDIKESGARNEGFVNNVMLVNGKSARRNFFELWNSTVPKKDLAQYGWNANPWVWVIEFERIEKI